MIGDQVVLDNLSKWEPIGLIIMTHRLINRLMTLVSRYSCQWQQRRHCKYDFNQLITVPENPSTMSKSM